MQARVDNWEKKKKEREEKKKKENLENPNPKHPLSQVSPKLLLG